MAMLSCSQLHIGVVVEGDEDGASKTLIAIAHISDIDDIQFLIAVSVIELIPTEIFHFLSYVQDPHYSGAEDLKCIVDGGFVKWFSRKDFSLNSFYNLCLPQLF